MGPKHILSLFKINFRLLSFN